MQPIITMDCIRLISLLSDRLTQYVMSTTCHELRCLVTRGNNKLHVVALMSRNGYLNLLKDMHDDVDKEDTVLPCILSSKNGHFEVLQWLVLEKGYNWNIDICMYAAGRGR